MSVHHFEVFGQHIATAQAWYSQTGSDNVTIKDVSGTYSYGGLNTYRMIMYGIDDAVPFNILTYFMQKYNNDLTQFIHGTYYEAWNLETGEQVAWDGGETGLYDRIFYIGYVYDGTHNSIHFVGGFGVMQAPGRITAAHGRIGYNGMSLDSGPNSNDIRMAELYIIKYLENDDFEEMDEAVGDTYYPDWTRGHGNEEGAYTYPRGEGYRAAMNGTMYCEFNDTYYFFNTSGITFLQDPQEIVVSEEVIMTSPYYGGGWWWGPDPRTIIYYSKYYRPNGYATDWNAPWWYLDELTFFIPEEEEEEEGESEDGDGTSVNGGGGGGNNHKTDSLDDIDDQYVGEGAIESGAILLYQPSTSARLALSGYLWSEDFLDTLNQSVMCPIDAILNLMYIPINLQSATLGGSSIIAGTGPIVLGNTFAKNSDKSLITASLFSKSWCEVTAGPINIGGGKDGNGEQFGNAYDYGPYTSAKLYVPYVGFIELDMNELFSPMAWTANTVSVYLRYLINLFTGEAVVRVYATRPKSNKNATNSEGTYQISLGQFTAKMGFSLPVSGANFSAYYKNEVNDMIGTVGGIGMAAGGLAMSNPLMMGMGIGNAIREASNNFGLENGLYAPSIVKSGSTSGSVAANAYNVPFIEIMQPTAVMDDVGHRYMNGQPTSRYVTVSDLQQADENDGYAEFESVRLNGFKGNEDEATELLSIMKSGVIINTNTNS